ncbi:hypothetical protein HHK36_008207 [Tetracentron sinense]|uniref:Uncharacterized protein n=1 Tax=Tetracentron sinense TaxID=13715 RepID=A0A835DMZ7_TETSI|nr:hypothetical protein HHK36_008207 [Tetracentron sinense]
MERDPTNRWSSYFSSSMTSPSCLPVDKEYDRVVCGGTNNSRRWRNLLRRTSTRVATVKNPAGVLKFFEISDWIYTSKVMLVSSGV